MIRRKVVPTGQGYR